CPTKRPGPFAAVARSLLHRLHAHVGPCARISVRNSVPAAIERLDGELGLASTLTAIPGDELLRFMNDYQRLRLSFLDRSAAPALRKRSFGGLARGRFHDRPANHIPKPTTSIINENQTRSRNPNRLYQGRHLGKRNPQRRSLQCHIESPLQGR